MSKKSLWLALLATLAAAALAGCASSTDAWIDEQAERLVDAGVTFRRNRRATP